jgi:hypothetical protein
VSNDVFVFVGPTLDRFDAAKIVKAEYLPPADQGSVFYVSRYCAARTIVFIDGAFGRVPAVRHKEILWARNRGVRIFGAASIGAIRAAKLCKFGMVGMGIIFRWYRATLLADDDDVALAMGPIEMGAPALSEALINIRMTFPVRERRESCLYPIATGSSRSHDGFIFENVPMTSLLTAPGRMLFSAISILTA